MFDMGFTEILLIAVVALLFIGPDKLPDTLRTIARTFGKVKRGFEDAKSTIQTELQVDELRQEALSYKAELEKAKADLSGFKNIAANEVNGIKQEVDSIKDEVNKSFEPKGLNDADDLLDLDKELEEAESEFAKLEKEREEFKNKTQDLAKEAQEHLANSGFKNLKPKDS